ncbi:MAG: hypothetical protein E7497_02500 [Ruminococcus sp.]|nr:hypothetical protein [Ruminococcus sp.]
MKKYIMAVFTAAVSAVLLTGCADKLDGKWELCTSDGDELVKVRFDSEDGDVKLDEYYGEYEELGGNELKIEWDDEELDDEYGGTFSYEILDKEDAQIYIDGISEMYIAKELEAEASTLMKAGNSSLVEMDVYGENIGGYWVVSSDDDFCLVPGGQDKDRFMELVESFFPDISEYEFVIAIDNGVVSETYLSTDWNERIYAGYTGNRGVISSTNKTLEDIAGELIG